MMKAHTETWTYPCTVCARPDTRPNGRSQIAERPVVVLGVTD